MMRTAWTAGTSVETTLELWASWPREVKGRMRPLFSQEGGAAPAGTGRGMHAPGAGAGFRCRFVSRPPAAHPAGQAIETYNRTEHAAESSFLSRTQAIILY
ncbi:hypothetical protein FV228_18995 [Methylobacterium sp. WL18]|nr:hypothetical protein FV228_18995 [Methylobacterium sp. WL18]